jgi:hypothetical protein
MVAEHAYSQATLSTGKLSLTRFNFDTIDRGPKVKNRMLPQLNPAPRFHRSCGGRVFAGSDHQFNQQNLWNVDPEDRCHPFQSLWHVRDILLIVLLLSLAASAQTAHYIRKAATGNGTGTSWTNACTDFSGSCSGASMVRGDTYYVAGGSYATCPNLSTAASGTTLITVKGAIASDHGAASDWNASYGVDVSRASWNSGCNWVVSTPYWNIDGNTGTAYPLSGLGFGIRTSAVLSNLFQFSGTATNITLAHFEVDGINCCGGGSNTDGIRMMNSAGTITLTQVAVHDITSNLILADAASNITLDHSYLARNYGTATAHSQGIQVSLANNYIIRYNHFEDIQSTATLTTGICGGSCPGKSTGWQVYGNVFTCSAGFTNGASGWLRDNTSDTGWSNIQVYNNTFANNDRGCVSVYGGLQFNYSTGVVENNIFYCPNASTCQDLEISGTSDYNTYLNMKLNSGSLGAHDYYYTSGISSPFINYVSDLHLTNETAAYLENGLSLPSPFNRDPDGITRGADGTWERGAFEFGSASASTVSPPSGLAAIVQ